MVAASIVSVIASGIALAQNPRGKAEATVAGGKVTIEYGRPSLKGRDVLAEAPVGTVWRTGADQSTTFTSASDLTIGGKAIPKGSYSLFTKRTGEKDWALIFNKQTGQWGTDHDPSQDLVQVPLKWEQKASGPEQFTIELAPDALRLNWGKHVLSAAIAAK
jgi:hypothetical protein